jgi:hypothetical protein
MLYLCIYCYYLQHSPAQTFAIVFIQYFLKPEMEDYVVFIQYSSLPKAG